MDSPTDGPNSAIGRAVRVAPRLDVALAEFKDFCIDANDAAVLGHFWASALGLEYHAQDGGDAYLTGATKRETVWVNTVPEFKSVKHRVHLDVRGTVGELLAIGATVTDAVSFPWTVMADPEHGEFCVFDEPVDSTHRRLRNLVIDTADPSGLANWWTGVLGGTLRHDAEHRYVQVTDLPGVPFDSLDFVPVPEPKTIKNRLHIDVTCRSVGALIAAGAHLLRPQDEAVAWHVLVDPDGNEFCAFIIDGE
jgi:hypothetical protein